MSNVLFTDNLMHYTGANGLYSSVGSMDIDNAGARLLSAYGSASGLLYSLPSVVPVANMHARIFSPQTGSVKSQFIVSRNNWYNIFRLGNIYLQLNGIPYTSGQFDRIRVMIVVGSNQVELQSAILPDIFMPQCYHVLEMKVDHTNNKIQVKVDNDLVIDHTITNSDALADTIQTVGLLNGQSSGPTMYAAMMFVRDWIVSDDWVGYGRLDTLAPGSDTATIQWSPNIGTVHYNRVNTATGASDGDSTYVTGDTVGETDLYGTTGSIFSLPSAQVLAVAVNSTARNQVNGTRTFSHVVQSGGLSSQGNSNAPLPGVYTYFLDVFNQDPNGNVPWTTTSAPNSNIGVKILT